MSGEKILVADNDSMVRDSLESFLEQRDYRVYTAASPAEAKRLVRQEHIPLVIIDLRLTDDDDPQDSSGLALAQELDPAVCKIILTGYPTVEGARRALSPGAAGKAAAFDFISKADGPEVLLETVTRAFATKVAVDKEAEARRKKELQELRQRFLRGEIITFPVPQDAVNPLLREQREKYKAS